jgi:hypothetical protein
VRFWNQELGVWTSRPVSAGNYRVQNNIKRGIGRCKYSTWMWKIDVSLFHSCINISYHTYVHILHHTTSYSSTSIYLFNSSALFFKSSLLSGVGKLSA